MFGGSPGSMKKKKTILVVALAFVLLLGGAYVLYNRLAQDATPDQLAVQGASAAGQTEQDADTPQEEDKGEEEGQEPEKVLAPDFTVYDLDGNAVQLSDYIGKPIVLNFWASWCGPCQMEMPDFHEKYLQLGEKVNFLMINMTTGRETQESAIAFIEKNDYSFPIFYDTQSDAAMTYGAYSLPTTYFIDAEGYAIAQATGAIDAETLQRGIDMILPQK